MFANIWNNLTQWFRDRSERDKLVRGFNDSARLSFVANQVPTLLKAKISMGDRAYKHQFSHWMYTGFRIEAFTGKSLNKQELITIAQVVLSDNNLVRQLVVLGWDTLEVHSDSGSYGCKWQLKDYIQLSM